MNEKDFELLKSIAKKVAKCSSGELDTCPCNVCPLFITNDNKRPKKWR